MKNISNQLDIGVKYDIVCVSEDLQNPIVCPRCFSPLNKEEEEEIWKCENKNCEEHKNHEIGGSYGFDVLSTKSIQIYSDIHINRWKIEVNKFCPFSAKENCHMTLYQDACSKEFSYKEHDQDTCQHNAFDDMYDAILNAKEFVYIFAWSMKHDLIICPGSKERPLSVIELLKKKAEDIQVVVALWNMDNRTMM
jgi:ribosomal protein L37AE/L43A